MVRWCAGEGGSRRCDGCDGCEERGSKRSWRVGSRGGGGRVGERRVVKREDLVEHRDGF